ncbi:hypothetical protein NA78x_001683 [Anatilimnocola sp. NA78]|uniref:hypothetical protein n=1 Tax=Anatilimnocola sp. NA78 TaxID=3415683 RepID=UPI003CE5C433
MSKTIELPDETFDAIAATAALAGVTPEKLLEMQFRPFERRERVPPKPGETLYDRLKDFIGCVEGTDPDASKNTSEKFTDYLEQKQREGRL